MQNIEDENLERVKRAGVLPDDRLFTDLDRALCEVQPDIVLVCPVAEAHAACIRKAVQAKCHVLAEKPFVTQLEDGVALTQEAIGQSVRIGVTQNWRTKSVGQALKHAVSEGRIGRIGDIFFRYVRNREHAYLPDYLFQEPYPLLYAMGIHHFDLFRYILNENIVSVSGQGFRPPWSRYQSCSGVALTMTTEGGVTISYAGTFSSQNRHIPQESLLIDGEKGTLVNESAWGDPPLLLSTPESEAWEDLTAGAKAPDVRSQYDQADAALLEDFCHAVVEKRPPLCSAEDNLWTLAALEAAAMACETGEKIQVQDLLTRAGYQGGK